MKKNKYETEIKIGEILYNLYKGKKYYSLNELMRIYSIDKRTFKKYCKNFVAYKSIKNNYGKNRKQIKIKDNLENINIKNIKDNASGKVLYYIAIYIDNKLEKWRA